MWSAFKRNSSFSTGVGALHILRLRARPQDWVDGRTQRTAAASDAALLAEIKAQITQLPTYGYRRACALVNQQRVNTGAARVNAKRVYRVMAVHALLLPKAPRGRQSGRPREGKVAVAHSDVRWCSDGFEIKCDSGQTVTATFTKDCCDREILAYRAWEGKVCRAIRCARCSSRPWRSASAASRVCPAPKFGVPLGQRRRLYRGRDAADRPAVGSEARKHAGVQPAEQRHGR